ncbi:hypothetical protein NKG94_21325 [Micromonospora sp. M12]
MTEANSEEASLRYSGSLASLRASMFTAVPTCRPWRRPRVPRLCAVGSYGRLAVAGTVFSAATVATATRPTVVHCRNFMCLPFQTLDR